MSRLEDVPPLSVSWEEIEAARTPKGDWTRATTDAWGVPWPRPAGWLNRLAGPRPPGTEWWKNIVPGRVTWDDIEAARTPRGGFTYAQLREWGVPTIGAGKGWAERLAGPKPPGWKPKPRVGGAEQDQLPLDLDVDTGAQ